MSDNPLGIIGLVVCGGGLLLAVLAFAAIRGLFGNRNRGQMNRDDQRMWNERGSERPRYDSERIRSAGGFGNATPRQGRERGFGVRPPGSSRRTDDRRSGGASRRSRGDRDVRSGGGFGRR